MSIAKTVALADKEGYDRGFADGKAAGQALVPNRVRLTINSDACNQSRLETVKAIRSIFDWSVKESLDAANRMRDREIYAITGTVKNYDALWKYMTQADHQIHLGNNKYVPFIIRMGNAHVSLTLEETRREYSD